MNKDFFDAFEQHRDRFTQRVSDPDSVRGELFLTTGRGYIVEKVVETADGWVQVDGRDLGDEETPVSLVVPYHQIGHVLFVRRKNRMRGTGFVR